MTNKWRICNQGHLSKGLYCRCCKKRYSEKQDCETVLLSSDVGKSIFLSFKGKGESYTELGLLTNNALKDIKRQSQLIIYSWALLVLIFLFGIPRYEIFNILSWGMVFMILYFGVEISRLFSDGRSRKKDKLYTLRRYTSVSSTHLTLPTKRIV